MYDTIIEPVSGVKGYHHGNTPHLSTVGTRLMHVSLSFTTPTCTYPPLSFTHTCTLLLVTYILQYVLYMYMCIHCTCVRRVITLHINLKDIWIPFKTGNEALNMSVTLHLQVRVEFGSQFM